MLSRPALSARPFRRPFSMSGRRVRAVLSPVALHPPTNHLIYLPVVDHTVQVYHPLPHPVVALVPFPLFFLVLATTTTSVPGTISAATSVGGPGNRMQPICSALAQLAVVVQVCSPKPPTVSTGRGLQFATRVGVAIQCLIVTPSTIPLPRLSLRCSAEPQNPRSATTVIPATHSR